MRAVSFVVVGAAGFVVQAAVLTALNLAHWPVVIATACAVESAVLTNYVWHERWTWRDRRADAGGRLAGLVRFHVANGLASLVGTTALTSVLATSFGVHLLVANALAVTALAALNYAAADRWVFRRSTALVAVLLTAASASPARAAEPTRETVTAWDQFVRATDDQRAQHEEDAPLLEPQGRAISIPGGTIHEWRGSIVVSGTTVDRVVDALLDPYSMPPQEDVAEVRVLARQGDTLRVYMKLVRKVLVTVTYDTEHDVRYSRRSSAFATSRSISTRIAEANGGDRGFLWRLNSYWRYRQVGDAVQIDVISLSLSRDVPWILKPVADPIVRSIGRDSMSRTLATVAQAAAATRPGIRNVPGTAR